MGNINLTPITLSSNNILYINDDHFICSYNGLTKVFFYDKPIYKQCYNILYDIKYNNKIKTIYVNDYFIKMI
jgi:hypothetical protein